MASLTVPAGGSVTKATPGQLSVVGHEVQTVGASANVFTADYVVTGNDQSINFLVLTGAIAGTVTVTLYNGATHASLVETKALVKGGAETLAPADSLVLTMTVVADRRTVIGINPAALDGVAPVGSIVSLNLVTSAGFTAASTVAVVCLSGAKRHQK